MRQKRTPAIDDEGFIRTSDDGLGATEGSEERIFFSSSPAALIQIDGDPEYQDVPGTELQRIVNTKALVLRDDSDMHYLKLGEIWMEADGLAGPWSPAGMLPDGLDRALAGAPVTADIDQSSLPTAAQNQMPAVFTATTPAALIVTDGDARFVRVNGTPLLRLENTSALVYKEPTDKEMYVHLSNGWFRAWTMDGAWERVPESSLPADLGRRNAD